MTLDIIVNLIGLKVTNGLLVKPKDSLFSTGFFLFCQELTVALGSKLSFFEGDTIEVTNGFV